MPLRLKDMTDLDVLVTALENQGSVFGGSTRTFALALANDIKRLKRIQETDHIKEANRRYLEAEKERKIRGEPDPDDDIPF